MENNKGYKIVAIIALCVSIIGISVAFAALSQDLTVNGNGVVDPVSWNVHFDEVSSPTLVNKATVQSAPALGENNKVINYNFIVRAPGDSMSFTFKIKNEGSLDAEISSITGTNKNNWEYAAVKFEDENGYVDDSSRESAANDINLVKDNLEFSLVDITDSQSPVNGEVLTAANGERTLRLTVTYKEGATGVPLGAVKVTASSIVFTYIQSN